MTRRRVPSAATAAAAVLLATFALASSRLLPAAAAAAAESALSRSRRKITTTEYEPFPARTSEEAAVIEWGHSAIISALDGAVASFGPQTSRGAFFEVETAPILADPIDGVGNKPRLGDDEDGDGGEIDPEAMETPGPLDNAAEVEGNMVVMTNAAGLTGVEMARIAKESGAAALLVVNVDDGGRPDFIYRLEPETETEERYAEEHVDVPVVMVSRTSGNVLTTASFPEGVTDRQMERMRRDGGPNVGMPERVRLYAGGDRPFFEDVAAADPTVYLIHNMLTSSECDGVRESAVGVGFRETGDGSMGRYGRAATVWRGQLAGHAARQVEERIEQVTGYPSDHYSDWTVEEYGGEDDDGFRHARYDYATAPAGASEEEQNAAVLSYAGVLPGRHPIGHLPMVTITVFLDSAGAEGGGEIVYPNAAVGDDGIPPPKISPRKGMAVVHHNTDAEGGYDQRSVHARLPLRDPSAPVYVARKFVYDRPLAPSRRVALPALAMACGGKLPSFVQDGYLFLARKYGLYEGEQYFDKACVVLPMMVLLGLASLIGMIVQSKAKGGGGNKGEAKSEKKPKKKEDGKEKKTKKKKKPTKAE